LRGIEAEFEVYKAGAAVEQLNWAIRLFLERTYIPAITLAGASEEILGGAVESKAAHGQLKKKLSADYSMTEKVVSDQHLSWARNWLKHWGPPDEAKEARIELEDHALQLIIRALHNLQILDLSPPAEAPRLCTWLTENRSDLPLGCLTARWLRSIAAPLNPRTTP
jgi:hypothetical protein